MDSLRRQAKTLFDKAGPIKKVNEIIPQNQLRGGFIIEGAKTDINVWFTLSPENPPLIQEFDISERPKK